MLQEQEGTGGAAQAPEARARGQQPGRHGGQAQVSNAEHKVCSVSVHFVLVVPLLVKWITVQV